MAKFAWHGADPTKVLLEFEGEWLEVDGDIVCVMEKVHGVDRALAVVRLHPGQSVKIVANK